MSFPLVSCLCPTFNRAPDHLWLLAEAVESFLRQDYAGPAELLILNDTPGQKLECGYGACSSDGSRSRTIRVYNWATRIPTLGEKRNILCNLARGSLLCPWDDDDLSLPWRIRQGREQITALQGWAWNKEYEQWYDGRYWKPPQVIFLAAGGKPIFEHSVGVRHHASIFTRHAWEQVGGYPLVSGSEDMGFDQRLYGHLLPRYPEGIPPQEWAYIYRWSVSPRHLSGVAGGSPEEPHRPHWDRIGQEEIARGVFHIKPHWREDYVALSRPA